MSVAVAQAGSSAHLGRCGICGRASPRGAKLCGQCIAAVKRVRQVNTVTAELLPESSSRGAASPRIAAQRSARRKRSSYSSWLPARADGWIALIAFGLFGAAVAATGYLAIEEIGEGAPAIGMPMPDESADSRAESPAATGTTAFDANVAPAAQDVSANVPPTAVEPATAPDADASSAANSAAPTPVREKRANRKSASESRHGKIALAQGSRTMPDQRADAEATAVASDAGAPPSEPTGASVATIAEPMVLDRWEKMRTALASCARENFLGEVVCAERVRLEYCEGFWGQVPQCRAATRPGTSR